MSRCNHLSASSIAAFKACPTRFRLAYDEGLRPIQDTDALRMGTNWHKIHEVYANANKGIADFETKVTGLEGLDAVSVHLNEVYANVPMTKTPEEWTVEREILLQSFIGYLWYWQNDPLEFLASEVPFSLPVKSPRVRRYLPKEEVLRVGKIDHIVKWQGAICALERKSTASDIDPDAKYWERSRKDTQVSMYALAFRDMPLNPISDIRRGNTLYDVWHKPKIAPKTLTQGDTAAFIESGEYCGQKFEAFGSGNQGDIDFVVKINGELAEIEFGKKGFAIRETPAMFGARLLADIQERPAFYFQRKEIVRTDAEITEFEEELYAIYQAQKMFKKEGCWYENENQCRANFPCPYIPICYSVGAKAVCDGKTTPDNFKRIFVDMTVRGESIDE